MRERKLIKRIREKSTLAVACSSFLQEFVSLLIKVPSRCKDGKSQSVTVAFAQFAVAIRFEVEW
jgi:predicted Zn-ribbon and HTH transcriptional regulator